MPSSAVEVCNDALDRVGAAPILSLDDNSVSGRLCARNFPLVRDHVLSVYPWNSTTARASLAASLPAPPFGFANRYPLPADCLRVLGIEDEIDLAIRWRVEGREVLTDAGGPLLLRYSARADVGLWSPALGDAVAVRMAARMAFALTGNATLAGNLTALADSALREARRLDAIEASQDDALTTDDWLRARL